ncbi:hypothetical protein CRG98_042627 [Punica granatum]|uniref:Uncharacterized protein n=1 Tax=Punica granatum TaxID=22663 RepID=A0A2I0HZ47_PUNGR|nr:hypothetical protein CRG98_042627 [Punica granatum]
MPDNRVGSDRPPEGETTRKRTWAGLGVGPEWAKLPGWACKRTNWAEARFRPIFWENRRYPRFGRSGPVGIAGSRRALPGLPELPESLSFFLIN